MPNPLIWTYLYTGQSLEKINLSQYKSSPSDNPEVDIYRMPLSIGAQGGKNIQRMGFNTSVRSVADVKKKIREFNSETPERVVHKAASSLCQGLVGHALFWFDKISPRISAQLKEQHTHLQIGKDSIDIRCILTVEALFEQRKFGEIVDQERTKGSTSPLMTFETIFRVKIKPGTQDAVLGVIAHRIIVHDKLIDEKCPWLKEQRPGIGRVMNVLRQVGHFFRTHPTVSFFLLLLLGAGLGAALYFGVAVIPAAIVTGTLFMLGSGTAGYDYKVHRDLEEISKLLELDQENGSPSLTPQSTQASLRTEIKSEPRADIQPTDAHQDKPEDHTPSRPNP